MSAQFCDHCKYLTSFLMMRHSYNIIKSVSETVLCCRRRGNGILAALFWELGCTTCWRSRIQLLSRSPKTSQCCLSSIEQLWFSGSETYARWSRPLSLVHAFVVPHDCPTMETVGNSVWTERKHLITNRSLSWVTMTSLWFMTLTLSFHHSLPLLACRSQSRRSDLV